MGGRAVRFQGRDAQCYEFCQVPRWENGALGAKSLPTYLVLVRGDV